MRCSAMVVMVLGVSSASMGQCWDTTLCNQVVSPGALPGDSCLTLCPNFACWASGPGSWCKLPGSQAQPQVVTCEAGVVKIDQFGTPQCLPKRPRTYVNHTFGVPICFELCEGGGEE